MDHQFIGYINDIFDELWLVKMLFDSYVTIVDMFAYTYKRSINGSIRALINTLEQEE